MDVIEDREAIRAYDALQARPAEYIPLEEALAEIDIDTSAITGYRYITRVPGVLGGRPVIKDTRVSVKTIAGYYKLGMSPDEILDGLPHITPAQLFEALSYYYDHQDAIEQEIAEDKAAYGRLMAGEQP